MAKKWWDGVENLEFDIESIDYRKYLNCPACKKVELYCPEHRKEVEILIQSILETDSNKLFKVKIKKNELQMKHNYQAC